jgi:hypothetical protein
LNTSTKQQQQPPNKQNNNNTRITPTPFYYTMSTNHLPMPSLPGADTPTGGVMPPVMPARSMHISFTLTPANPSTNVIQTSKMFCDRSRMKRAQKIPLEVLFGFIDANKEQLVAADSLERSKMFMVSVVHN